MTTAKRARLKYPVGSRWKIRAGLPDYMAQYAGKPAIVKAHEFDEYGGVKAICVEVFGGVQWWSIETCDELLEAE